MIRMVPLNNVPRLHTTPLAIIQIRDSRVIIEADDAEENRVRLVFQPYQAVLVTTEDCYIPVGIEALMPNTVMEAKNSLWLKKLRAQLREADEDADFLETARHYVVPLQDEVIEIVAWNVTWEKA